MLRPQVGATEVASCIWCLPDAGKTGSEKFPYALQAAKNRLIGLAFLEVGKLGRDLRNQGFKPQALCDLLLRKPPSPLLHEQVENKEDWRASSSTAPRM